MLLRDLRNGQAAAVASREIFASGTLESIAAIAKQAGGTLDILARDEDNQLVGLFYQDEDMRNGFKNYPEIVFVDAIYKTNDRRLPLYFICVEDLNGYTEVAGFFRCVSEDEDTIRSPFNRFVVHSGSEHILRTSAVMTEEDFTERKVVREIFSTTNFYIRLFHVLRTFKRNHTGENVYNTSSQNRDLGKATVNLLCKDQRRVFTTAAEHSRY